MEKSAIAFTRDYIDSLSEAELATFDRGTDTINGRLRIIVLQLNPAEIRKEM